MLPCISAAYLPLQDDGVSHPTAGRCYPVASQNTKDFYNLVNVYLDAVLHPRAKRDPMVLAQEGWHYELEDPAAPLTYKGVVFNEMKGDCNSTHV